MNLLHHFLIPHPSSHVVKFEDPLLQAELAGYAKEIYRTGDEVAPRLYQLSICTLTKTEESTFDLLCDETVTSISSKEKPDSGTNEGPQLKINSST